MFNVRQFNDWYANQDSASKGLLAQYVAIRRADGANWPQILQELIAALPNILEFIKGIISLFNHGAAALIALAILTALTQAAPPPARLAPMAKVSRCCDCCTCVPGRCDCTFPGDCLYSAAYHVSRVDGKPLVVFVGQPEYSIAGCRTVAVPAFPRTNGPCVVMGIPNGSETMNRIDMSGIADAAAIRNRLPMAVPLKCEAGFCPTCRRR